MTEIARDKIDEAEFFLEKLEETSDADEFRYYLSAFLSACWSIFDHLGAEWRHQEEFEKWYMEKKRDLKSDQFYYFMIRARNSFMHFDRPETETNVRVKHEEGERIVVENTGDRSEFFEYKVEGEKEGVQGKVTATTDIHFPLSESEAPDIEVNAPFYFTGSGVDTTLPDHYSDHSVLQMCEEFLEEMRCIVEVAEEEFDFIPGQRVN